MPLHANDFLDSRERFVELDDEIQAIKEDILGISLDRLLLEELALFPSAQQPVVQLSVTHDDAVYPERVGLKLEGETVVTQHDYLSAISHLQIAEAQGLLPSSSENAGLLLARMKLAYGMRLEAASHLHELLGETVAQTYRNRARYELARAFSRRGYNEAAAEELALVQGELPADIVGDYQLLRATILMSLNRNREAARELAQWRGATELAAYAHYNHGIALLRAGDTLNAVPALEMAVDVPSTGEEQLAIKDRARLSLGYYFAAEEDYKGARSQLTAIRPQGPFSNRALLALGWTAYKQGKNESALKSWMVLQSRSPIDPAVLEALFVVPGVHREQGAMQIAIRDYEAAITTYTNELNLLRDAKVSLKKGEAVLWLLQDTSGSALVAEQQAKQEIARFSGPLRVSRNFTEIQREHGELLTMLERVDRERRAIDSLKLVNIQSGKGTVLSDSSPSAEPSPNATPGRGEKGVTPEPQRVQRRGDSTNYRAPGIPQLPEAELPPMLALKPFPDGSSPNWPPDVGSFKAVPNSEIFKRPDTGVLRLPKSGDFFGKPNSGPRLSRRRGKDNDYAYPDWAPEQQSVPGNPYWYQLRRQVLVDELTRGFNSDVKPVGKAARRAAARRDREEMNDPNAGLDELIAALYARILNLQARIVDALALYENHTRALTLEELHRRQLLLEGLLEQARLELAVTYDQSSDR